MMKQGVLLAVVLAALGMVTGCAAPVHGRGINDPANSLVFGYIDMDEAPTSADGADFWEVPSQSRDSLWYVDMKHGLFFSAYLPPGTYQVSRFMGAGLMSGGHDYVMPVDGNETKRHITKPGIYFVGSYKYKKIPTGFLKSGKFSIEKVSKPTEAELLQRILDENNEVKNSAWGNKIHARLAQLKH